jgi:acetylglutamate kinase
VLFMSQVGMKPVLVHGGGPSITDAMKQRGKQPVFVDGRRVTDAETLAIVEDVLINQINNNIVEAIRALDGRAVAIHNRNYRYLHAEKLTFTGADGKPYDLGYVGKLVGIDVDGIERVCASGFVPVIAPLATDASGQVYNVNADAAAGTIAAKLRAEKIVFLSDVHGIMTRPGDPKSFLSSVDEAEIQQLIKQGVIAGGMLPKVDACLEALEGGVGKAHIIDGRMPHSLLLEIFTDAGVGTQILKKRHSAAR